MAEELTPMMKQFRDIKTQYPDAMLLFRCGDFYETYAEDAVKASKILNITLTHRSNGGSTAAPAPSQLRLCETRAPITRKLYLRSVTVLPVAISATPTDTTPFVTP